MLWVRRIRASPASIMPYSCRAWPSSGANRKYQFQVLDGFLKALTGPSVVLVFFRGCPVALALPLRGGHLVLGLAGFIREDLLVLGDHIGVHPEDARPKDHRIASRIAANRTFNVLIKTPRQKKQPDGGNGTGSHCRGRLSGGGRIAGTSRRRREAVAGVARRAAGDCRFFAFPGVTPCISFPAPVSRSGWRSACRPPAARCRPPTRSRRRSGPSRSARSPARPETAASGGTAHRPAKWRVRGKCGMCGS